MTDRDELFTKIQDALHAPCVKRWELLRQLGKDNETLTKHGANMHKDQAQEVFDVVKPEIERYSKMLGEALGNVKAMQQSLERIHFNIVDIAKAKEEAERGMRGV